MKTFIGLLLIFITGVFAISYENSTDPSIIPKVVSGGSVDLFSLDVVLDTGDIGYSTPIAISQMEFPASADTAFLDAGIVTLSCYDTEDDGTATDTISAELTIQKSLYAADNIRPNIAYSDVWTTLVQGSVTAESEAQAIGEASIVLDIETEDVKFLRMKVENLRTVVTDQSRCRVFWSRKAKY